MEMVQTFRKCHKRVILNGKLTKKDRCNLYMKNFEEKQDEHDEDQDINLSVKYSNYDFDDLLKDLMMEQREQM